MVTESDNPFYFERITFEILISIFTLSKYTYFITGEIIFVDNKMRRY